MGKEPERSQGEEERGRFWRSGRNSASAESGEFRAPQEAAKPRMLQVRVLSLRPLKGSNLKVASF